MFRIFLVLFTLSVTNVLYAHQPDQSSTMLVEKGDGDWVLQVRAALTAFEYEVLYNFGKDSYKTAEEFNELVLTHLRNSIDIVINADTISLEGGSVKLGHESSVLFELKNRITNIETVSVIQKSFVDISRNQSALVLLKKGMQPQQFILDENNSHEMNLEFRDSVFVATSLVSEGGVAHSHVWQYLIAGVALSFLLYFVWKKMSVK